MTKNYINSPSKDKKKGSESFFTSRSINKNMARKPRLILAGYPYHVILRGNNRSSIFFDDGDRIFFIRSLRESKVLTHSKVYAYCLMTNHVHLIVEPSTCDGLGKTIQSLGRRYVQFINHKYKRSGTLWEGRYKSCMICRDKYLLICHKYIELNPVRAQIVREPREYRWSSYRCKAEGKIDELLDYDVIYNNFGKTMKERQINYRKLFDMKIKDEEMKEIKTITERGGILGDKSFINKISEILGRAVSLVPRGRPRKVEK